MGNKLNLKTYSEEPASMPIYLDNNFREIENAVNDVQFSQSDSTLVTGTLTVQTKFKIIDAVLVSLTSAPSANACYVLGYPHPSNNGSIIIEVKNSAYAAGSVAIGVQWLVLGQE